MLLSGDVLCIIVSHLVLQLIAVVLIAAVGQVIKYRIDIGIWVMVGVVAIGAVLAGKQASLHPCKVG